MDRETIQAIATEVAKQLPSYSWTTLVIQVVLTCVAAAAAAYLGAYFKKRGEHLATKDDFKEILRQEGERTNLVETIKETIKAEVALSQLEASTKIVEKVRSELAQRDWAAREWANLRRVKIEELLGKVNECREYLMEHMHAAQQRQELPKGDPINDLETITRLYFPELKDETKALLDLHRLHVHEGQMLQIFFTRGEEVANKYKSEYADKWAKSTVKELPRVSEKLTEAARELLEKIMGVRTQSEAAVHQNDVGTSGIKSP
jgi:hypothetical protein